MKKQMSIELLGNYGLEAICPSEYMTRDEAIKFLILKIKKTDIQLIAFIECDDGYFAFGRLKDEELEEIYVFEDKVPVNIDEFKDSIDYWGFYDGLFEDAIEREKNDEPIFVTKK